VNAPSGRRELAIALALSAAARALVLYLGLVVLWNTAEVSHMVQDLRTWHDFFVRARLGLVPYVDFAKEYPVGAGLIYWALTPLLDPENLRRTVLVHGLAMGVVDLVNVALFHALLVRRSPRRAFAFTLAFSLNLTALLLGPLRFESVLVLFTLLGYGAASRARPLRAVAWWSVGFWIKWVPAFFVAVQEWRARVVDGVRWRWLAAFGVFCAVGAALNAPFVVAGWHRGSLGLLAAPWRFHMARPLYWDTLLGVGQLWLGPLPWERYGSWWTLGLVLLALVVRPSLRFEYKAVLLCIAAILFNRIYSAQFNLWFYPLLLLGAVAEPAPRLRRVLGLAAALDLLNAIVFPFSFAGTLGEIGGFFPYAARLRAGPWTVVFSTAIVARALVLVALAAVLLRGNAEAEDHRGTETQR
jgi:hypothetical protein